MSLRPKTDHVLNREIGAQAYKEHHEGDGDWIERPGDQKAEACGHQQARGQTYDDDANEPKRP